MYRIYIFTCAARNHKKILVS